MDFPPTALDARNKAAWLLVPASSAGPLVPVVPAAAAPGQTSSCSAETWAGERRPVHDMDRRAGRLDCRSRTCSVDHRSDLEIPLAAADDPGVAEGST